MNSHHKYWIFILAAFALLLLVRCVHLAGIRESRIPPNPYTPALCCSEACGNMFRLNYSGWEGSPGPDGKFHTEDDLTCVKKCMDKIKDPKNLKKIKCIVSARSRWEVRTCLVN